MYVKVLYVKGEKLRPESTLHTCVRSQPQYLEEGSFLLLIKFWLLCKYRQHAG